MTDVFKALADSTRREILLMLSEEPNNIGQIVEKFNMSRPAIAKHIKILQSAKLIGVEPNQADGRQRKCYAQLEALAEVEAYMAQLEKFWKAKFNGLENYLSKKKKQ